MIKYQYRKNARTYMQISTLITNVALLFIMMLPGVILKKCNMCSDSFGKGLSNLVLYIAQPALIVCAYIDCRLSLSEIWRDALAVLALSVVAHLLFSVVALSLFHRAPKDAAKMLRFVTIFSNAAFLGIPLIQAVFDTRPEMAIYASIYNITFNLFLWTLGVLLCTHEKGDDLDCDGDSDAADLAIRAKREVSLFKVLLHPVTLASAIGIALLALGINSEVIGGAGLGIISDALHMVSGLVAPLSMTVIGLRLADISLKGFFSDAHMYLFLALRHLVLPLALLGLIKLSQLAGIPIGGDTVTVVMLLASTPAASSATMFAEKYNCDAKYVSRLVTVSTILSIATMPLVIALI